jgi:hypothetical protein
MPAAAQAFAPARLGSQHRPQDHVILQDQLFDPMRPVPLRSKLEMPLDYGCKKAKLWLWILIGSKTPSSCLKDVSMSRQDEDFYFPKRKRPTAHQPRLLGKGKPAPTASADWPDSTDPTWLSPGKRHRGYTYIHMPSIPSTSPLSTCKPHFRFQPGATRGISRHA